MQTYLIGMSLGKCLPAFILNPIILLALLKMRAIKFTKLQLYFSVLSSSYDGFLINLRVPSFPAILLFGYLINPCSPLLTKLII
jgi:hypothetical protein